MVDMAVQGQEQREKHHLSLLSKLHAFPGFPREHHSEGRRKRRPSAKRFVEHGPWDEVPSEPESLKSSSLHERDLDERPCHVPPPNRP